MVEKMTESEQFYYGKGYAQGKIDFAKEVVEQVQLIESCHYSWLSGSRYNL